MAAAVSFSGVASGIDSKALIEASLSARRKTTTEPLEARLTVLSDQNSAYSKLTELLNTLKGKADTFRTINGAALSYSATASDEFVLSGAASKTAVQGSYQITATQLAKNATASLGSSATTYTSATDKISAGASFSDAISVVIGNTGSPADTVSVAVNENTTLQDFVTSFNSQTSDATASIVNTGTENAADYRIVVASKNTGTDKGLITLNVGSTITARGAVNTNSVSNAQNAIFSIAGVGNNIQRSTNTVSDVLQGVSFSLKNAGTASLSVGVDSSSSSSALKGFVSAYNDVVNYITEQDAVTQDRTDGVLTTTFGPLASTSLDESIVSTLRSALSGASSTGGVVNVFADLGVSTQRDGTLAFDESAFQSAVGSDPAGATRVLNNLGDKLANTNGTIDQFTGFGRLIDSAENSNNAQVSRINQQMTQYESYLSQLEQSLTQRFSSLESLIGKLNGSSAALTKLS